MDLKEFMKRRNVSEQDIVEAVELINAICRRSGCYSCPLKDYVCLVTTGADIYVGKAVRECLKKFLHNLQDAGAEHVDFDDLHKFLDELVVKK